MKAGWDRKQLSELLQKTGSIDPTKEPQTTFTYIDVSSVSNETLSITETSDILGKDAPSRARRGVRAGDVIFATIRPTLKRVAIIPDELDHSVCSTGYFVLRSGAKINNRFLFYWLISNEFEAEMEARQKGASYPAVNDSDIRDQFMPVPPLDEQRRIVAVLDKAFAGIATATANAQKNLTNARALFESYANDAFEELALAVVKRPALETLTEAKSGITYGVVKPGDMGSVPFVRGGDLIGGEVRLDRLRTITHEVSAQYNRTLLRGGELLMCLVGVPGQCAIAPPELDGANIARQVGLIRLRPEVNAEYVKDYLQSPPGQKSLGTFTGGSVQQVINLGDLRQVEIPLPDRPQQDEIVKRIAISKRLSGDLVKRFEAKFAALAEIKQSLLQKAFAGELT